MATASLFDDCKSCLLKNDKTWKSYFSKWEDLAKQEENLPEDELETALSFPVESIPKRTTQKPLPKKKSVKKRKTTTKPKKFSSRGKKVVEEPIKGNENLSDESANEQLELDLRAIFMDILKGNKNKWEIFSVLSQTFSHVEVTKWNSHHLSQNHHLALTSNDVKMDSMNLLLRNSPYSDTNNRLLPQNFNFETGLRVFNRVPQNLFRDNYYVKNTIVFNGNLRQGSPLVPAYPPQTPFQCRKINFNIQKRFLKSCPYPPSNLHNGERNKMLKPLALDFGNIYTTGEYSKINNENFVRTRYEEPEFQHAPETNIYKEKSFQNLCLHKRTNDVSLNMENSNFITPKRKPSERKCFSENILHRKRRRSSKLAIFDYEESESDDDDDRNGRSPKILWPCKKRKFEGEEGSDSDLEIILERVKRP